MIISTRALRRASLAAASALALGVAALGGWYAASPRLTLGAMQQAALGGDAQGFSRHVDYPALRQSLKGELQSQLDEEARATQAGTLKAVGIAMARAFIDPLVESAVSPETVGLVLSAAGDGGTPFGQPALESLAVLAGPKLDIRRDGVDAFHVTAAGNPRSPELTFRRDGLSWRLSAVDLDPAPAIATPPA